MNDAQYGLSASNSEVWSQSAGVAYRKAQRHQAEPCTNKPVQRIQNSYHQEQAIEVEAIEIETLHTEPTEVQAIEMQRMAHEVQPVKSPVRLPTQASPAQDSNPGLLDIGFWLNLPE